MNFIVKQITAYDRRVIGCETTEKDIMISYTHQDGGYHDVFLTQEQAVRLSEDLQLMIQRNEEAVE